eukprot:745970-Hanusia_phi.AAC.1
MSESHSPGGLDPVPLRSPDSEDQARLVGKEGYLLRSRCFHVVGWTGLGGSILDLRWGSPKARKLQ